MLSAVGPLALRSTTIAVTSGVHLSCCHFFYNTVHTSPLDYVVLWTQVLHDIYIIPLMHQMPASTLGICY